MTTTAAKEMTSRQSWAIRCASGLDVRGMDINYDAASQTLSYLNESAEAHADAVEWLLANGATGKPKVYKPYVKGQKKTSRKSRKAAPKVKGESAKDKAHRELWERACAAGDAAAAKCVPVPMQVVQRANVLDDNSPVVYAYEPTMGGVCGFSWSVIRPGNCSFANWLKKNNKGRYSDYDRGVVIWGEDNKFNGQSMETKMAWTSAFSRVIWDAGIKVYTYDRID